MSQDSLLSSIPFTPLRMDPIAIREPASHNKRSIKGRGISLSWMELESRRLFSDQHARLTLLTTGILPSSYHQLFSYTVIQLTLGWLY